MNLFNEVQLLIAFQHHSFWWQGLDGTKVVAHFPPANRYVNKAEVKEVHSVLLQFCGYGRLSIRLTCYLFGFSVFLGEIAFLSQSHGNCHDVQSTFTSFC